MTRKYIDCRDYPSATACTVEIAADSEQELMEAAVQHACAVHGETDTPELRSNLQKAFKERQPQQMSA